MKLFLMFVNTSTNCSSVSSCNVTVVVKRPINSGIIPNRVRSSGVTSEISCFSVFALTSAPNPIVEPWTLFLMIDSNPTNAPPAMNKMFLVSTSTVSPCGCFLLPTGLTLHLVPSTSFSNACCTPSPDTSRVMLVLSLFREILSISSMNTIPRSALLTSLSARASNIAIIDSTSSPTYPASVRLVASATTKGTFKYLATDLASRVLPDPVGPIKRTLPFCISKSLGGLLMRL